MAGSQLSFTTVVRRYLFSPVALGYLAVVAAVWVFVGADMLFVEHDDASFAGVWGFLVTAPTSLLFTALPGPLPWVGAAVAALVQAVALGAAYRWFTGRTQHRTGVSNA